MLKALVTAGSEGAGREIVEYFGQNSLGISRRSGHDIRIASERKKIVELSLQFDIVANHAYSRDPSQLELLRDLFTLWREEKKSGYIFTTGTYGTYHPQGIDPAYISLKSELDRFHLQCCQIIKNEGLPFRMTLIRPGMLDTPRSRAKAHWRGNGVRGRDIAQIMEFFYKLPTDLLIENFVMESILDVK